MNLHSIHLMLATLVIALFHLLFERSLHFLLQKIHLFSLFFFLLNYLLSDIFLVLDYLVRDISVQAANFIHHEALKRTYLAIPVVCLSLI